MLESEEIVVGAELSPLLITDLTVSGGAVAKHHGRVVFLNQGLIGDVVSAKVAAIKKKVVEAEVSTVLSASPFTIQPLCPHFGICGGCTWQNLAYAASLDWKQRHVQETLIRIGRLEGITTEPVVASPKTVEFRNKLSFAFANQAGQTVVGFRQRFSHEIVQVTNCILQPTRTMEIVDFVRKHLLAAEIPAFTGKEGYLRFLVVRTPDHKVDDTKQYHIEIITAKEPRSSKLGYEGKVRALAKDLMEAELGIIGVVHSERKNAAPIAQGETVLYAVGARTYQETIGSMELTLPVTAFLQTNTGAATQL